VANREYSPEIGDRVGVLKNEGTFTVTAVDRVFRAANVRLMFSEYRLEQVPWDGLVSLKKMSREDVNQAVARIVMEATRIALPADERDPSYLEIGF